MYIVKEKMKNYGSGVVGYPPPAPPKGGSEGKMQFLRENSGLLGYPPPAPPKGGSKGRMQFLDRMSRSKSLKWLFFLLPPFGGAGGGQLAFFLLLLLSTPAFSQQLNYLQVDSTTYQYFLTGKWKELQTLGKQAIKEKIDYPYLNMRMGYSYFMTNKFGLSSKYYEKALKSNPNNKEVHYYQYLNDLYMGRGELANYQAKFLADDAKKNLKLKGFIPIKSVDLEGNIKSTNNEYRKGAQYVRLGLSTQLTWRISWEQSASYFRQELYLPRPITQGPDKGQMKYFPLNNPNLPSSLTTFDSIYQAEYYSKFAVILNKHWQANVAYHYLYSDFHTTLSNNHIGLLSIKYYRPYFDVSAEGAVAYFNDSLRQQYGVNVSFYPLANGNLYVKGRATYQISSNKKHAIYGVLVGGKLHKYLWAEANATFNGFNQYFENDALYVYNAVDNSLWKAGTSFYIPVNKHFTIQLHYGYDKKQLLFSEQPINTDVANKNYSQHSITTGLSWKI